MAMQAVEPEPVLVRINAACKPLPEDKNNEPKSTLDFIH